jgi:hypothetical protein
MAASTAAPGRSIWPGDDNCDLERYLPPDPRLVLYDRDLLAALRIFRE